MAGKKQAIVLDVPHPRADCSVFGCGALTSIREQTPTGWANFCEHHYIEYHHRRSKKRVREEMGLETVEQMKAFCRKKVKTIFKSMRSGSVTQQREPGQDDEEMAA